jgi:hypothetical protein
MMHLFAESPFNVLAVGNATGDESILLNHRIAVGGLEESHRILELMEILSKPNSPVFNLITSWHIMGVSLGGQTAYYTSVLLSQNKDVKIHAPVQSVIAFCPVINLEPTVRILDSKFLFGNQFRKLMLISGAELLAQMKDASPITQADLDGLTKGNLADTLARVGLPRLDNAINKKHLLKPPFAGTPFKDANDLIM